MSSSPHRTRGLVVTGVATAHVDGTASPPERPASALEATGELYARARNGDRRAWEDLLGRYGGVLQRFAHARLPAQARGLTDTCDVVQEAVIGVWGQLERFEFRHRGALLAYLRQAVRNRIIDAARRAARRPASDTLTDSYADPAASPLEHVIGVENHRRYRAGLARLKRRDRLAIVLRLEHRLTYEELASRLGMSSSGAARVALARALHRLASLMPDS